MFHYLPTLYIVFLLVYGNHFRVKNNSTSQKLAKLERSLATYNHQDHKLS